MGEAPDPERRALRAELTREVREHRERLAALRAEAREVDGHLAALRRDELWTPAADAWRGRSQELRLAITDRRELLDAALAAVAELSGQD